MESSEPLHLRDLSRRTNQSLYAVRREVENLVEIGLIRQRKKGNLTLIELRKESALYSGLHLLFSRTEGVLASLRAALRPLPVRHAFVYGSFCRGGGDEGNPVDLAVVGEVPESALREALKPVSEQTGREFKPLCLPGVGGPLLRGLLQGSTIFVAGDRDRLVRELG